MIKQWTENEIELFRDIYPELGQDRTAKILGRSPPSIRAKASRLGLRLSREGRFWKDFQFRAGQTKIGRKRPDQADVLRRMWENGMFPERSPEQRAETGRRMRRWIRENGHPRGALGMRHTDEAKATMSKKSKARWKRMTPSQRREQTVKGMKTRAAAGPLAHFRRRGTWKAAWREIGGIKKFYRSRWEANYARLLEWRKSRGEIARWSHEPDTFWFDGVKRGCVSYLPDFKVTLKDGSIEYHEVKGWMDPASKTKLKRMKKYHPKVVLVLIDGKVYRDLEKLMAKTIPGWE